MKTAHRYLLLPLLLLVVGQGAMAAAPDDPLSMIVEAKESLDRGDPVHAAVLAERVQALIAADAGWDPDGSIGERLLPALQERIARMRDAILALDHLVQPPGGNPGGGPLPRDPEELLRLVRQTVEESERLKEEIRRIAGTVPQGPERGGLLQSKSYGRAANPPAEPQELAQMEDALRSLQTAAPEEGDTAKALRARLDAVKREVIELVMEGEKLRAHLDTTQRRLDADQARMIEFIGDDPSLPSEAKSAGLNELGAALMGRLRDRYKEVQTLAGLSPLQKALYIEELDRFRLANEASVAAGSRDLSGRIEALAEAIERAPLIAGESIDPSMSWLSCMSQCWR